MRTEALSNGFGAGSFLYDIVLTYHPTSLLLRGFVFRKVEERLMMNRKGPWEGYRQQALSPSRLPLRAHFHREKEVWERGSHPTRREV